MTSPSSIPSSSLTAPDQPPNRSQEVQQSSSNLASAANTMATKTSETMSSAAASLSGAVSGGFNFGMRSKETTTTTTMAAGTRNTNQTGPSEGMGKDEAAKRYEEAMEGEYAKREGGA